MRAPAATAEAVLAALLELSPAGLEQVDGPDWVEYAIYGAPGEVPALGRGTAEVGGCRVEVRGEEVPDDWAERWRRFHGAVQIGGRLYVRPPWEPAAIRPGVHEIVIDPGRAFGTGAHPTTRMCLELMLEVEPRGSFADLGCGSGVLAIAAAKLGWDPVAAYDADAGAIEATKRNAAANTAELARVERLDLRRRAAPRAHTVTGNLTRQLLLRLADGLGDATQVVLASGMLDVEADAVATAFTPLTERRRLSDGGWSALLLAGD